MSKKKEKKQKTKTYMVTAEEIEKYIQKGYEKGRQAALGEATNTGLLLPIITLRDRPYDWGREELLEFVEAMYEQYDSIIRNYQSFSDIRRVIKEEVGIEINLRSN